MVLSIGCGEACETRGCTSLRDFYNAANTHAKVVAVKVETSSQDKWERSEMFVFASVEDAHTYAREKLKEFTENRCCSCCGCDAEDECDAMFTDLCEHQRVDFGDCAGDFAFSYVYLDVHP